MIKLHNAQDAIRQAIEDGYKLAGLELNELGVNKYKNTILLRRKKCYYHNESNENRM